MKGVKKDDNGNDSIGKNGNGSKPGESGKSGNGNGETGIEQPIDSGKTGAIDTDTGNDLARTIIESTSPDPNNTDRTVKTETGSSPENTVVESDNNGNSESIGNVETGNDKFFYI